MRICFVVLLACLSVLSLSCRSGVEIEVAAFGRHIPAEDGHQLASYELITNHRPVGPPPAALHYIQGSENVSVTSALPHLAGPAELGVKVVMIERRGIDFESADLELARASSTKDQRVRDHLSALEAATDGLPPSVPLIVAGSSEGGDVAAAVARRSPRVTHLVLIGSGGGWTQAAELQHFLRRDGQVLGVGDPADLEAVFSRIRENPASLEDWAGHPYRRWSSFLWSRPADDLLELEIPIFLVHGSADASVPVESARALAEAFRARGKENLTYREYEGTGHDLLHQETGVSAFPRLEVDLLRWFGDLGVLDPQAVTQAEARVRRAHPEAFRRR